MERSSFFNAILNQDGNPDRHYLAEDYARYFSSFIGNGVYPNPSTNLQVVANDDMTITVKAGKAWVNGYFYENTDDLLLNIDVADGTLARIDRIVLRLDFLNREIKAFVKKGDWNSSPKPKELQRNSDAYELALANININHGAISITQSAITDTRLDNNVCGIVHGIIKQADTTALYKQIQSDLLQFKNGSEADFSNWTSTKKSAYNMWTNEQKADFKSWFNAIKDVLGEDEAGNLLNLINSHTSNTDIHTNAEEKDNWIVSGRKEGTVVGKKSVALGRDTTASGYYSTAMGSNTTASGDYSTAMGYYTTASEGYSTAMGLDTTASEGYSTAMGFSTVASGQYSTAMGYSTTASETASTAMGKHNKTMSDGDLFVIGNGTSSTKSNAFRVTGSGQIYGTGAYHSSGADYSEYFEWLDGNPSDEDRVGHFVTLDGEKIKYANDSDYIVGIVSATPAIVGDSASENWKKQYKTDIYGRIQYEEKTFPEERDGEVVIREKRTETVPILSPDYDPEKDYLNRERRKEWAIIGMFGKLIVVDDGSCKINGYCKPNNGRATKADKGYRVMARLDSTHIKVLIK